MSVPVGKIVSIHAQRTQVRRLLDDSSPADAPTAYYALFHDPARSALFTHAGEKGRVTGFVAVCQTGVDLFRPLLTLQCPDAESAAALLGQALKAGRPYILFARVNQLPLVSDVLRLDNHRILHILRLDPRRFQPVINVLARSETAHDGTPRCVIESGVVLGPYAVVGDDWIVKRNARISHSVLWERYPMFRTDGSQMTADEMRRLDRHEVGANVTIESSIVTGGSIGTSVRESTIEMLEDGQVSICPLDAPSDGARV